MSASTSGMVREHRSRQLPRKTKRTNSDSLILAPLNQVEKLGIPKIFVCIDQNIYIYIRVVFKSNSHMVTMFHTKHVRKACGVRSPWQVLLRPRKPLRKPLREPLRNCRQKCRLSCRQRWRPRWGHSSYGIFQSRAGSWLGAHQKLCPHCWEVDQIQNPLTVILK